MDPPDLTGMPKLEEGCTRFFPPAFLPTEGKGLLVLEELNRAPVFMRAPCLMLLTARSLNDYKLPPGWLPVATINPPEDGYEAEELDAACLTRFTQINVVPDRDEWIRWAQENDVDADVINYVSSDNYSSLSTTIRIPDPSLFWRGLNDNYFSRSPAQSVLSERTALRYCSLAG